MENPNHHKARKRDNSMNIQALTIDRIKQLHLLAKNRQRDGLVGADGAPFPIQVHAHEVAQLTLLALMGVESSGAYVACEAMVKYNQALTQCKGDDELMLSYRDAHGKSLDQLYDDMFSLSVNAIKSFQESKRV